MKKKQLLVFIMAGSLAAGMSPVTMAFAEADTQTVTIEDTAAVAAADTPVEEPAQAADTPTAEPTQAAADTPAAEPTQAAADTPAAEPAQAADAVVDDGFNSGDTAELTLEEEESATPTPETTGQIILKAADGTQTSYSTLAEAIAAAPKKPDSLTVFSEIFVFTKNQRYGQLLLISITIARSRFPC